MGPCQSDGEVYSFGTACYVQAWSCLSTGARLTVVFLTFSVLRATVGGGTTARSAFAMSAQTTTAPEGPWQK